MKVINLFSIITLVLFSVNGYSGENHDSIKLYSSDTVSKIKDIKSSAAIAQLLDTNNADFNAGLITMYQKLQNNDAINITDSIAKYLIILDKLVAASCFESPTNVKLMDTILTTISNADTSDKRVVSSKLDSLSKNNTLEMSNYLFPLLYLSNSVCSKNTNAESAEFESKLNKAGGQLGSSIVLNDSLESKELVAYLANQFEMTAGQWEQNSDSRLKELKEKGFITVSDKEIGPKLNEFYNNYKDALDQIENIQDKLIFSPIVLSESKFPYLGSEVGGGKSELGFSSVTSIYDSPVGKLSVSELDIRTSESVVFYDPKYFNVKVGEYSASLIVYKGKKSGLSKTNISWTNENTGRDYSVEANINLNDPLLKSKREALLQVLSKYCGS